jgi:hypothetical protein
MATNFTYGSGNPLYVAPKTTSTSKTPVSQLPITKDPNSKAAIDARIAATNEKVTEALKPVQTSLESQGYAINPATGLYFTSPVNTPTGSTNPPAPGPTGPTLTAEQLLAQQQAKLAADTAQANRQSAYDLLLAQFTQYGLQGLVEPLKGLIQDNISPSEFAVRLRQTEPYKKRFAANASRIANGLSALSEGQYVALEDQYQNIMRNYGLPASYYAKGDLGRQEGFEKFIAGDVSPAELEERVATAQNRVVNAPPLVKEALKQFYPDIKDADILAYTLDPTKGLQDIKRKVTAAEIGGAALGQGLGTTASRAEELARFGVTAEAARQGYQSVAEVAPRGSQLAAIYGESPYGQAEAEQEVFGLTGSAEAAKLRKKLSELERSAFSGQAGTTAGALSRDRAGSF